ncbi:DUF6431 domain-containing protein [Acidithrix ferrooxidans]|uniref:DUF6431 domain-containing protein n=1 Tax=Acidithrix ferrooxidans TaxID=1280514 RepID=A0A0D8HGZ9_9ACTN|nr:DUF6431 domain-containing protein [Acidithrix ferrooxidans]KJF17275.1 hypothetical protein AXFE_18580 [Acidithrix ferrooxidans]
MAVIVSSDPDVVESELLGGKLFCPSCNGVLRKWAHARSRTIRMRDCTKTLCPRRSRCSDCFKTSVLLPDYLLVRRVDEAAVIGSALVQKAEGLGHRKIAANICRPETTVRGWLRRFREKLEIPLEHFTNWALVLDVTLSEIAPAGSLFADAISAIGIAVRSLSIRFGPSPPWSQMSVMCGGRLLSNTNSPFPAPS